VLYPQAYNYYGTVHAFVDTAFVGNKEHTVYNARPKVEYKANMNEDEESICEKYITNVTLLRKNPQKYVIRVPFY